MKTNPVGWIQTYSGIKMWPLEPDEDTILLPDIAHALSFQCRFGGHSSRFYSVGQHCILVSDLCAKYGENVKTQLAGLLHDATEAYLVDLPRPVKLQMPDYKVIEAKLEKCIANRFKLSHADFASVKKYDEIALAVEAEKLMCPIHPEWNTSGVQDMNADGNYGLLAGYLSPEECEIQYLKKFKELWSIRKDIGE